MAHLTIVTKRSSMTPWPIGRNVYTLIPQTNSSQESPHILTAHNTNTPRITSTSHQQISPTVTTYDDSLTNLSWLHDINILKRTMPPINASTTNKRKEQPTSSDGAIYPNDISDTNDLTIRHDDEGDDDDDQWRMYKSNPRAKPIYSYSQLILLAMKQSGQEKMTLQMIYEWVAENFPYFKKMEPTWQNSIRHNLSLNKCFVKVPRAKKESSGAGKGGFWKLSLEYQRQRQLHQQQQQQQQQKQINSSPNKRTRYTKRSAFNATTTAPKSSSRISHENIKLESWVDPVLPSLHCQTSIHDRSSIRLPSSFLSPTSSPDSRMISPFHPPQKSDLSSILTPSPSTSPAISKQQHQQQHFNGSKLDETDMLLLDPSTFDWDAYLCETTNDIDGHPLSSTRTEHDLFCDFSAALTDLTSSAEAVSGADTNPFYSFDYTSKQSTFHSLFEDDEQPTVESPSSEDDLAVKGSSIKRPSWWSISESLSSTKLPSLEAAFDLKFSK